MVKIITIILLLMLYAQNVYAYELSGNVSINKPRKPIEKAVIHIDNDKFAGINLVSGNQIIIKNGLIYVIDTAKNTAYTYHVKSSSEKGTKSFIGVNIPDDVAEYMKSKKAAKTGVDKLLGYDCDIYTYTEGKKELQKKYTLFIKQGTNIPLRTLITSEYYGDAKYEFIDIKLEKPDNTAFELPHGIQVMPKD